MRNLFTRIRKLEARLETVAPRVRPSDLPRFRQTGFVGLRTSEAKDVGGSGGIHPTASGR